MPLGDDTLRLVNPNKIVWTAPFQDNAIPDGSAYRLVLTLRSEDAFDLEPGAPVDTSTATFAKLSLRKVDGGQTTEDVIFSASDFEPLRFLTDGLDRFFFPELDIPVFPDSVEDFEDAVAALAPQLSLSGGLDAFLASVTEKQVVLRERAEELVAEDDADHTFAVSGYSTTLKGGAGDDTFVSGQIGRAHV